MLTSSAQFVKFLAAAILSSFLIWTAACSNSAGTNNAVNSNLSNQNTNDIAASSAKDDVEELGTIVNLPEMPEESVWREEENANPNGKKLTAVLRYSFEAAGKITASAEKIRPAAATEISAETWFPAELTAQSQLSGNESLKANAYDASNFYNPPYKNGKLMRVAGTNYFVLELTSF